MFSALDAAGIPEPERTIMRQYFEETAPALADPLLAFRRLPLERLRYHLEQDPTLVHRQAGNGNTLLHAAAGAWDVDRVNLLLEKGARVDFGDSPLYSGATHSVARAERSADSGRIVAEILICRGADVNRPAGVGDQTPLHMAARRGNIAIAQALL